MESYRLDNAALIFPSIISRRETTLSRIAITLKNQVQASLLQKALSIIITRFPYFQVYLRFGFRWPYFRKTADTPQARPDIFPPCMHIEKDRFLFNVWYRDKTVAVEFSHILSDAKGTLLFLNALVYEYCCLTGEINRARYITNPYFPGTNIKAEQECAYRKHYRKLPNPPAFPNGYHVPDRLLPKGVYHVTTVFLETGLVLDIVRKYRTTLNTFFAAVYALVLADICVAGGGKKSGIVRLEIPINMRQFYQTDTLRNFSLFLAPAIRVSDAIKPFPEILSLLSEQMKEQMDSGYLERQIARNVGSERNWFIHNIPMVLKHLILKIVYKRLGEKQFSGFMTNLGSIEIENSLGSCVQGFTVVPAPSPVTKTNCAIHSYGNTLQLTFGSAIEQGEIERKFIERLNDLGIVSRRVETTKPELRDLLADGHEERYEKAE